MPPNNKGTQLLEEIDLLVPEIVDRETGYRYSAVGQLQKILACEEELAVLKERRRMLKAVVVSRKKLHKMEKVYFEALPAITVASHRTIIPSLADLGRLCCEVIGPEMARLGCECPEPGYCYTIEHGGYKPQDIDIEYCEKVTRKGTDSAIIQFKDIPEVPVEKA